MKQYACLNPQMVVIAVEFLNIFDGDNFAGAEVYIQVGPGGVVETVPTIGQVWDGETCTFN